MSDTKTPSILKQKYKENPFMRSDGSGVVVYKNKTARVDTTGPLSLTDTHTGEHIAGAQIRRVELVDSDKFVKLYVANLDAFFDLKPGTIRIMTAVLSEVADARNAHGDTIYLNYNRVKEYFESKDMKAPARPTFFRPWLKWLKRDSLLRPLTQTFGSSTRRFSSTAIGFVSSTNTCV